MKTMKLGIVVGMLLLAGCVSPTAEQLFRRDMQDKRLGFPPSFSGPTTISDVMSDLEHRWNREFPAERPIHIVVVLNPVSRGVEAARHETPAEASLQAPERQRPLTGGAMIDVLQYVNILAEAAGLQVEIAPASRTIILYKKGQQSSGGDSQPAAGLEPHQK